MNFASKATTLRATSRPQMLSVENSHARAEKSSVPASNLQIKIDRITLRGYAPADQSRFTRTLSQELTKLARAHSDIDWSVAAPMLARIRRLDAGQLSVGASAEDAARHIAQNIFERLTQRRAMNRGPDDV